MKSQASIPRKKRVSALGLFVIIAFPPAQVAQVPYLADIIKIAFIVFALALAYAMFLIVVRSTIRARWVPHPRMFLYVADLMLHRVRVGLVSRHGIV